MSTKIVIHDWGVGAGKSLGDYPKLGGIVGTKLGCTNLLRTKGIKAKRRLLLKT